MQVLKLENGKIVQVDIMCDFDGGFPDSIYLPSQCFDGGGP